MIKVDKTIKNEAKELKNRLLSRLLGILAARSLVNLLAGKAKKFGQGVIEKVKERLEMVWICNANSALN